jgi:predicted RNA-binding protein with PUA-like domain
MCDMKKGDFAFFYHSNCKVPGVVGVMEIVEEHSTDGLLPLRLHYLIILLINNS